MSSQMVFDGKGTAVDPKCVDCGMTLANYSLWIEPDGPFCSLCYNKRLRNPL